LKLTESKKSVDFGFGKRGYSSESVLDSGCYDSLLFGGYHVIVCFLIVPFDFRLAGVGTFEDGQRTVAARFERLGVVVPPLYDFLTAPPGIPQDRLSILQDTHLSTIENEELQQEAREGARPIINPGGPDQVETALQSLLEEYNSEPIRGVLDEVF
jgi:hypothetical protein